MVESINGVDRRAVLKALGAASGAGMAGLAGCVGGEGDITDVTALGGDSGGTGYQMCLALQAAVEEAHDDIRITVSGTDGWSANASMMFESGRDQLGVVPGGDLYDIAHKTGDFEGDGHYLGQMLPVVPPNWVHLLALQDSDFESWSDLDGASVNVLSRGTLTEQVIPAALEAIGVEPAEYLHYPHDEASNAIVQGDVDVVGAGGIAPAYLETSQQDPLKALTVREENRGVIQEEFPFMEFSTVDFGEHYEGPGEATVPTDPTTLAALIDADDDLIYDMTAAMYEHLDTAADTYEDINMLEPSMLEGTVNVVHPGALRYYEEQGIEIPDEVRIESADDLPLEE
ncbi:TAXI family TRAP transporter solute-binding subunit [Haloterrigena sp. SYSU A121-1]|uniref:TAXI family TRAP transporter solute-binding subunit n=1 Tax=Haloterrigena gelatinilytica TaxID=2741724 RepID=A0A8J8GPG0_9EURY|nr:TAXI family TRAP transporter solute-binding subunit [Haloterrigena gelatinilytica]NUB93441.1 TAXI family TRAP transporter solute-binding subunit [Haloterrigena gelatinilytica]